jgi:glycosyltransferase 2 family protein
MAEVRWWRVAQVVAGLAIVGFAVRAVARNWEAVRASPLAWEVRPGLLAASVAVVLVTYGLLVEAWRRVVAGWGSRLAFLPAARVWVLSSMGKYLPGKVWAVVGMAALGREAGVPAGVATASAIVLQLLSVATGALVVAATGLADLERVRPGAALALLGLLGLAAGCVVLVARPALLNRLLGRWSVAARLPGPPGLAGLSLGAAIQALAWVAYGVALFALAEGVLPQAGLGLRTAIAAFTASYLAGFLFLLAPGGLGVREGVFVLLTQGTVGPAAALALAALSRIGMTVADLLAAAPFVLFRGSPRASA